MPTNQGLGAAYPGLGKRRSGRGGGQIRRSERFRGCEHGNNLDACRSGLRPARRGRPLVEPLSHLFARCRQPQHRTARRRLLLGAAEGWRIGSAPPGRLRRTGRGIASARCARPAADGGRRRDAQLDTETGRVQHQCDQSYVVGGYIRSSLVQWAPRVDRVLDEKLQRVKSFVEGKSPTQWGSIRAIALRGLIMGPVNPLKGETLDGEEIWRGIRGWALPADASPVRLVGEASAQQIP